MGSCAPPLPEYQNPPLIEVVLGVQFKELVRLKSPHVGSFWERLGRDRYPGFEEMPPLRHIVEEYGTPRPKRPNIEISAGDAPPLPRVFFVSADQNQLVQLQKDRFLQNWRRHEKDAVYPRYGQLLPQFVESWSLFRDFVQEQELGKLDADQYELTYVNHIEQGSGWTDQRDIEAVFPWFKCKINGGFLALPEEVAWRSVYVFPGNAGRLHAEMKQGVNIEKDVPVLVMNLTARGFAEGDMNAWFNLAHEWIVRGFADLTGLSVQEEVWKRTR